MVSPNPTHQQNINMHQDQALPSKPWQPATSSRERVRTVVSENAVIVIARRGCCMGHVVRRLLLSLGVNPAAYDVDDQEEDTIASELKAVIGGDGGSGQLQFPAVFIGGRLFGGLDRIMTTHITGELTPVLKQAGALWL